MESEDEPLVASFCPLSDTDPAESSDLARFEEMLSVELLPRLLRDCLLPFGVNLPRPCLLFERSLCADFSG